ncbi:hypothetical protein VTN31DRAFT_2356 [Thermomyces dupontii]|uniref:uncharacterized protein n=1 Tax=Talaromyces thermophilus TaxID=28565 RepID=UPI00374269EE
MYGVEYGAPFLGTDGAGGTTILCPSQTGEPGTTCRSHGSIIHGLSMATNLCIELLCGLEADWQARRKCYLRLICQDSSRCRRAARQHLQCLDGQRCCLTMQHDHNEILCHNRSHIRACSMTTEYELRDYHKLDYGTWDYLNAYD